MSKRLRHRGPDPEDERAFNSKALPVLRQAIHDVCWLLDRGYALPSAAALAGDRYKLGIRQRLALGRCACPAADVQVLKGKELSSGQLRGTELWIDAFNVITAVETALGGGYIFIGVDGCCRDIAGVHRRYHRVEETHPGVQVLGECLVNWGVGKAVWWLDGPVSNSGRLKKILQDAAAQAGWNWQVELVLNPDRELSRSEQIVATADRIILKRCRRWFNFGRAVIQSRIPQARVMDFSTSNAADERTTLIK